MSNSNAQKRTQTRRRPAHQHVQIDPLVKEALDYINEVCDNKSLYKCFNKRNNQLSTFGIYNSRAKKYSIHHVENFFPVDFEDLKMIASLKR